MHIRVANRNADMQKSKWFILLIEEAGKMEVSVNEDVRPAERANILMVISNAIQHALTWINWFFSMTKADRYKAGIDTSGEGRDE